MARTVRRHDDFQPGTPQPDHRLWRDARLEFQQRFVDPAEFLDIQRTILDALALAALRRGPQQAIEQHGGRAFAPCQCIEQRRRCRAEQRAAKRRDSEFAAGQAVAEHAKHRAQPVRQHPPGVVSLVEMPPHQRPQRLVRRQRMAPQRGRGKTERAGRIGWRFPI